MLCLLGRILLIARPNRSAGVLACEFGRRLAARIRPKSGTSQRDAAGVGSRDGCATRARGDAPVRFLSVEKALDFSE